MAGRLDVQNTAPVTDTATGRINISTPSSGRIQTAPTENYFYAKTPEGGAIGRSDQLDSSGKPLFAYRNPGDTATTTDSTRTATSFDPRTATTTDRSLFKTPRALSDSTTIKKNMGGAYSDELDHKIALELSGSNQKTNLQVQPGRLNGPAKSSDGLENQLARDVASGKLSLFDAQTQLAKSKGFATPWTGATKPQTPFDTTPLGIIKNTALGIPKTAYDLVKKGTDYVVNNEVENYNKLNTELTPQSNESIQAYNKRVFPTVQGMALATVGDAPVEIEKVIAKGLSKLPLGLRSEASDTLKILTNLSSKELSRGGKVDMEAMQAINSFKTKVAKGTLTQPDIIEAQNLHRLLKEGDANSGSILKQPSIPTGTRTQILNYGDKINQSNLSQKVNSESVDKELQRKLGLKNTQGGFVKNPLANVDVAEKFHDAKTQFYDKYDPIHQLVKDKNISADSDPYIAARNYAGHMGKVENRLNDLSQILTPAKAILPEVKQYALLERYQELAGRGIEKFPDGLTPEKIATQKAALESKLGPQGMAQVQDTLTKVRAYNDRLLTEAKDAGIISDTAYNSIRANNQKYIPLQRLEYLAEQGEHIPAGTDSFSVASQNLIRSIKGSEKAVADPIESMLRNTSKTVNLIERNKVSQKVADLSKRPEFTGVVFPVKGHIPMGFEKMSVFENGVKRDYAVPKNVGEALKGLNKQSTDLMTKWASMSSRALRAGATSLNLAFIPSNAIRDYQTARLVSKVGFNASDWVRGFAEAMGRGKDYKAFLEAGGGSGGYFVGNRNLPKTVTKLTEGKASRMIKTVLNPVKLLHIAGESIELTPRLGVFKRSLRQGLSPTESAFNARNATVDFSKSGTVMKVVNQWVPFLNARMQGTVNMFSAIKDRPVSSALKLSSLVGIPVVATYLNNTQGHPDIWNDIADFEKRNNFIIIYGDKRDDQGNPTQVVKIPKGDAKVFSNPLEDYLAYLSGNDTKSLSRLGLEVLSDTSPVDFEDKGKFSGRTLASSVLPPTVKVGVEGITNQNLYTGRDIVPQSLQGASPQEQYTNKTSPIAVGLGRLTGQSPMKIENAVGTQFGGLGRQLINPSSFGKQVTSRFSGAYGGQESQNIADQATKYSQEQADQKAQIKREAIRQVEQIDKLPKEEQEKTFQEIAKTNLPLAKEIQSVKSKQVLGFTSKDYAINSLGVENGMRAKFINDQLMSLKTREERVKMWDDLAKKKLLTSKVADQVYQLQSQPAK